MKNWKYIVVLPVILVFSACGIGQSESGSTVLNAKAFQEKITTTPEGIVLDVRTPGEFTEGHLENAVNIDWNSDNFDDGISKLDKTKPYFVYCLAGGRSTAAVEHMRSLGFENLIELEGGILKWRAEKLPESTASQTKSGGLTTAEFQQMLSGDKTILVDFYAEWCGPCKKMKPFLDEIATEMNATVKIIRIDVDKNPDLAASMHITALPTIQIIRNNAVIWTKIGFVEKAELVEQLKK